MTLDTPGHAIHVEWWKKTSVWEAKAAYLEGMPGAENKGQQAGGGCIESC